MAAFQTFLLYDLEKRVCDVGLYMQVQDTHALMQACGDQKQASHTFLCCSPLFFPLTKPGACYFGYTD